VVPHIRCGERPRSAPRIRASANPPDDDDLLALWEQERMLAQDSGNWSVDSLNGSYTLTADGAEDLKDGTVILERHV
jgi:hypothetical protein